MPDRDDELKAAARVRLTLDEAQWAVESLGWLQDLLAEGGEGLSPFELDYYERIRTKVQRVTARLVQAGG